MGYNKANGDQVPASEWNNFLAAAGLYGAANSGNDAYAITVSPAPNDYDAGDKYIFKADVANTGVCSLNVNGLGAKTIKKLGGTLDLQTSDILAGQIVVVIYDGVNFQMMSDPHIASTTPVVRVYTANDTWTNPAGCKYVIVEVQGGGGGGGGCSSDNGGSGGGGGGGYSRKLISAASLGSTETVTVGAAGAAGGATGTNGGAGGTSSFGSHCSATGGSGGIADGAGSAGGTGSSGDLNIPGGRGGNSVSYYSGSEGANKGGQGGDSQLGRGAPLTDNGAGEAGSNYGGGGAGAKAANGGPDTAGGAGAQGVVIVTEYYGSSN